MCNEMTEGIEYIWSSPIFQSQPYASFFVDQEGIAALYDILAPVARILRQIDRPIIRRRKDLVHYP